MDPEAPETTEAVLASMGTVIQQTKTAGKETLTLNGAVWEGNSVHLSLTAKSPSFPKHLDGYSWLSSDKCTARMPEAQWKEYVENKIARESAGKNLSKEERDQWFQNLMKPELTAELRPRLGVVSREGDTVQLAATMRLDNYRENPEVTLHIENVEITGQAMEQPGTRAGDYLLKGPFEFTFTLDNMLPFVNYEGNLQATINKVPVQITAASVSPTGVSVGYTLDTNHSAKAKKLSAYVEGVWTKDGRYVDCGDFFGVTITVTSEDGEPITSDWSRYFPYLIDPATVTAVKIGGTRVELGELNLAADQSSIFR